MRAHRPSTLLLALLATFPALPAQDLALELSDFPGTSQLGRTEAILEDGNDRLWFAFADGLRCHDGQAMTTVELASRPNGEAPGHLRCLALAADGSLLVGATNGLWSVARGSRRGEIVPAADGMFVQGILAAADGVVWLRSTLFLRRLQPGTDALDVPRPEACRSILGVQPRGSGLWLWDDRSVWAVDIVDGTPRWHPPHTVGPFRGALARGEDLELIAQGQLLRVGLDGFGPTAPPAVRPAGAGVQATLTAVGDAQWLLDDHSLWQPLAVGGWRRVRLYRHGNELGEVVTCMAVDRQGLVWVGTDHAAYRGYIVPGIGNLVLEGLRGDRVLAIAEHAGAMRMGTARGQLLRLEAGEFQRESTPWPQDVGRTPVGITCLLASTTAAGPCLYVGTGGHGLWRLAGTDWQPIVPELRDIDALELDADGNLWCATPRGVHVLAVAATTATELRRAPPPLGESRTGPMHRIGTDMLVAGYRRGLLRSGADATSQVVAGPWDDDSVLLLVPRDDALFVASLAGLWSVQLATGQRTPLLGAAPVEGLRAMAAARDGSLWLTNAQEVQHFDPDSRRLHTFRRGYGAHPRTFTARSSCVARDGSVWFGNSQGYTQIAPGTDREQPWPLRVLGARVRFGDRRPEILDKLGPWVVPGDTASFSLQARLLDRSTDAPPQQTLLLHDPRSGRDLVATENAFTEVPPGDYAAMAIVTLPHGATERLSLGTLTVLPPPTRWLAWCAGLAAALLMVLLTSRFRALYQERRRRVWFDRLVAAGANDPDLLDIAFLSVAVAEQCMRLANAVQASVWLRVVGTPRVCLAEIGTPDPGAAQRLERVGSGGVAVDATLRFTDAGDDHCLVVSLGEIGTLQFELLLRPIRNLPAALVAALQEALAPVRRAIQKLAWMRRLETGMADRSAAHEADLHDLRGPVTALRLSGHELQMLAQRTRDAQLSQLADTITSASERLAKNLEAMASKSREGSQLTLQYADATAVLRERIAAHAPIAANKGIRVDLTPANGRIEALFDPIWFARIVDNVLGNAIKYAPRASRVDVQVTATAEELRAHFDDEGPGFTSRDLQHLFVPGMTGSARPTAGESQTGMGLWIVRSALRAMGGSVEVGAGPGGGARITLMVPRRPGHGRRP